MSTEREEMSGQHLWTRVIGDLQELEKREGCGSPPAMALLVMTGELKIPAVKTVWDGGRFRLKILDEAPPPAQREEG